MHAGRAGVRPALGVAMVHGRPAGDGASLTGAEHALGDRRTAPPRPAEHPDPVPAVPGRRVEDGDNPGADVPQPCDLPFLLERFCLRGVRRYTCMESPRLDQVPEPEQETVRHWCFEDDRGGCECVEAGSGGVEVHRPHDLALAGTADIGPGGPLHRRHRAILRADRPRFRGRLRRAKPLSTGDPSRQVQILSEYNIFLFPVTDLGTAPAAVDLITRQGEGLKGPPGFDSHFRNFYETAREFAELEDAARSRAVRAVSSRPAQPRRADVRRPAGVAGPRPVQLQLCHPVGHADRAVRPFPASRAGVVPAHQRRAPGDHVCACDDHADPTAGRGARPVTPGDEPNGRRADFFLDDARRALLADPSNPCFADIGFYLDRMEAIHARLGGILAGPSARAADASIRTRLGYIRQNVYRLAGNLRQIYQGGVYVKFRTTP